MSTMLEQAIIDAAALKETAIKNAEAALIEKYSKEFKDTVEKLIEQEEVTPPTEPEEMSPEAASANAEDPTGPTVVDAPVADMASPTPEQSKAFNKVKSAFFDLDGDDDEMVTINFDGLKAKPVDQSNSMLTTPPDMAGGMSTTPLMEDVDLDEEIELELEAYDMNGGNSSYGSHSSGVDSLEEEADDESGQDDGGDLEEEIELELEGSQVVSPASPGLRQDAARDKQKAAEKETKAAILDAEESKKSAEKNPSEEEVELTEEELNEIEEALRVDMHNESEGYMGSHKRKAREFKNVAYAAARDDKKTEKREEEAEKLKDLQEALESIAYKYAKEKEKAHNLSKNNKKLVEAVENLREQVEKINLSNAKLLYTNKALTSISLNERQRNNLVESIARASSVSEAKTIFETLQSTVQSVREESTPKSLSEALNRSQTPFVVRKQPASQGDMFTERMKALAGIKRFE